MRFHRRNFQDTFAMSSIEEDPSAAQQSLRLFNSVDDIYPKV